MSFAPKDKFDFFESFTGSKVLIQYRKKPKIRNDDKNFNEIGMYVFDGEMNQVWTRDVKIPYTEAKMDNMDYQVDGNGNVYIMAKVYD